MTFQYILYYHSLLPLNSFFKDPTGGYKKVCLMKLPSDSLNMLNVKSYLGPNTFIPALNILETNFLCLMICISWWWLCVLHPAQCCVVSNWTSRSPETQNLRPAAFNQLRYVYNMSYKQRAEKIEIGTNRRMLAIAFF